MTRQPRGAPPARILAVGGGTGVHAAWLAEQGYHVQIVDLSPRHVAKSEPCLIGLSAHLLLLATRPPEQLVRRELDLTDGRFTNAILTDIGFGTLAEAAPGHVAHVRTLVIDVLSPEQLRRVGLAADRIMSRIDTSAIN